MQKGIHPKYFPEAKVVCACGNTWTTGSTQEMIRTDVCFKCHPFYTGEQRIVDTEGQVDRFYRKLEARQQYIQGVEARQAARTSPDRPIEDLNLGNRPTAALAKAGIERIGQVMEKFNESGEAGLLDIEGFGRKSMADLKKRLRQLGYEVPETTEPVVA